LVLKSDNPCLYWKFVLDAIAKPESELSDHIDLIHKSVWIPLANGCAIAPNRILHVEGINDEITRLTSATENVFSTLDKLNNDFKNHPAFEKFKNEILPRGETAFKIILNAIDMVPSYSVGVFPDGQSALIKEALPELINITKLPGWALISKAAEHLKLAVEDVLAGQKMKPLNTDDLVKILNELAQSEPQKNSLLYKAHLLHLHSLTIDSGCNNQHIKKLMLLAKSGNWKPAEDLCAGVSGVTASHLIDAEQQQALHACIYISNLAAQDEAINAVEDTNFSTLEDIDAGKIAHDYFGRLESRAKGPAIGCLLAVMGDFYKDLAQLYLKNKFTVDFIRKNLAGNELDKSQSSVVLLDSLNTAKIVISQVLHAKIETKNLLGNLTSFPIETTPETLLIGTPNWVRIKDRTALKVQFASIETLKQLSNKEINILLKRTTQILMRKIHHDKLDHVDALWKEIDKSDQLDIEIVRHKIFYSLPTYLAQLSAHRQLPIKEYHDRYEKAHETYITAVTRKDTPAINRADEQRLKHASLLANCISENKQAHQIVLDQVRKKIQGFDYAPDAVLFELFQNADDAAVELARCEATGDDDFEIPRPSRRLVIHKDPSTIRLMHWGRLINYRPPYLPDKWDGFGDDLIKMLVLNSSDKPDDKTVTGRFGLGFKSVFLVCDKPRIISGDLMVEICGSILPVPWKTANKANDLLHKYTKDRIYRGTLIELDISQGDMNQVNQRFEQNSGLLTVFSRAIRQIQIDSDSASSDTSWQPNVVSADLGVEVGKVRLPGVKSDLTTLLVVRTLEGSIALKLGPSGCEIIDTKVCPIWVTAPTRETDKIGFVVNGPFNIDAGRGRLAGTPEKNLELMRGIGHCVGQQFAELCQKTINDSVYWEKLHNDFRLIKECTLPVFWNSIWQVLCKHTVTRADSELAKLVMELVCAAFKKWFENNVPFPNGLLGQHAGFVRADAKFVQVEEIWNDVTVLDCLRDLNTLQTSDYVVVNQFIANLLQKSGHKSKITTLSVDYLVRAACEKTRYSFTQEIAEAFQGLATALESKNCIFDLSDTTKDQIHFLTESKHWILANSILCNSDLQDFAEEKLRYAFAPDAFRLASTYGTNATAFFVRCRGKMSAPTKTLADWILVAKNDKKRQCSALHYIADGQLANEVAELVRGKGWVANISPKSELLENFNKIQKDKILRALATQDKIDKSWSDIEKSGDELDAPPRVLQREDALRAIHEWWKREGAENLKQYDRKFWPVEVPRQFEGAYENRTSWMTLFALALMRQIGFTTDSKNRTFIELMQDKGWWDIFCTADPRSQGQDWLDVLKEYGETQTQKEEYSIWMDKFPRIYRIATWFDVYVQVFRSLDYREKWQIADYLSPDADHVMSGFDSAPTIRSSLRLGQHIVVRELLRCGELQSETAKQLAYMPSARVKSFFERIGYPELATKDVQSKDIYDVLLKILKGSATFEGAYDIPLVILAKDSSLQTRILGISIAESIDSDDE
jgi:hypothetical protein